MCYSRTKVISMALHKTTLYINGTWVTSRLKRAHPSLILTWRDKWLGSHLIPQPALQTETTADTSNGGFQTSNVCQDHWHSSHTDWYIQLGGHQTEKDMGDHCWDVHCHYLLIQPSTPHMSCSTVLLICALLLYLSSSYNSYVFSSQVHITAFQRRFHIYVLVLLGQPYHMLFGVVVLQQSLLNLRSQV